MTSTYTAKNAKQFRERSGSVADKVTSELALIDAELDIRATDDALSVGPLACAEATTWYIHMPCKADITRIDAINTTAFDASCVVTASVVAGSVAMTGGTLAIAQTVSASVIGYPVYCTPTANNEVAANSSIQLVSDAAPSAGAISVVVTYQRKA